MLDNSLDEEAKEEEEYNKLKKKKNGKEGKEEDDEDKEEIIISEKEEDDDENQENGIIQKKLKILVINGKLPGTDGEDWVEAKALVQNGTNENVIWGANGSHFIQQGKEDNLYKSVNKEDLWDGKASLCCGGSGSAVMQLSLDKITNLTGCALSADVVVLVNTDGFEFKDDKLSREFESMLSYRKVILYGDNNKNLNLKCPNDTSKCKHLNYEEGCGNLLGFIQTSVVGGDPNSDFIGSEIELEIKKIKKNIKLEGAKLGAKLKEKEIEVLSDFEGKNKQKRLFDKVKQYAKKNPKKTKAGMVAGAGIIEELVGQLGFGKSILGTIFGYNSNPKEKDAKNVKDNKKHEKKSDKKVNNSGNQVK